jgi:hypothetical protein
LIDFGYAPVDTTLLGTTTIAAVEVPPIDQTICHTGRATGFICGQLADQYRWGAQYLLKATATAGDSGGPVWTRYGIDELGIVGIWSMATTPLKAGSTLWPRPSGISVWRTSHCNYPSEMHCCPEYSVPTSA